MLKSWPFALIAGWSLLLSYASFAPQIKIAAWRLMEPEPFIAERVWEVDPDETGTRITATFRKQPSCELATFRVMGAWIVSGAERTAYITYTDMDGLAENFDRDPGAQTLRILAQHGQDPKPQFIELRTAHDCGGPFLTTRVFARVAVP